jgi:hypothetical protein
MALSTVSGELTVEMQEGEDAESEKVGVQEGGGEV